MDFTPFILYMNQNKNKKRGNKTMPQIISPPESKIPEKRPIVTTCPHCQYTISYTEDEVERVENDSLGVYCPKCGNVIKTKNVKPFTFPDTFYHFGKDKDSAHLSNEEIQKYVNIVERKLNQECKIGDFTFSGTGNIMVFGFKMEDEDIIYVAENYWEDSVFR